MSARQQKKAIRIKTALLTRKLTVKKLGEMMNPPRPRSTVSQAIHKGRFAKVRRQIKEILGI